MYIWTGSQEERRWGKLQALQASPRGAIYGFSTASPLKAGRVIRVGPFLQSMLGSEGVRERRWKQHAWISCCFRSHLLLCDGSPPHENVFSKLRSDVCFSIWLNPRPSLVSISNLLVLWNSGIHPNPPLFKNILISHFKQWLVYGDFILIVYLISIRRRAFFLLRLNPDIDLTSAS